jgi:thioredoxin-dependent peroxiredoxin
VHLFHGSQRNDWGFRIVGFRLITKIIRVEMKKWSLIFIVLMLAFLFFNSLTKSHYQNKDDMKEIKAGDVIPNFALYDQDGSLFDIKNVLGKKKLVIYFYPKDDSPGCTREACHFRDEFEVFQKADAVIIGISGQSVESHKKFALKYGLSFTLLSDKGNNVRKLFGVPTNIFGLLPGRVTYVADRTGKVIYVFNSQMEAERHVDEALKILEEHK